MRTQPDAVVLLRKLMDDRLHDGFDPRSPGALAGLERILDAPPAPPPPRRRPARAVAVAGAVTLLAGATVAVSPFLGHPTDVIARAAAALSQPGTIMHFRAELRYPRINGRLTADPALGGPADRTLEVWQTAGARQVRELGSGRGNPGGDEYVENWDTKTAQSYNGELNQLIDITEPRYFDPAYRSPSGITTGVGGAKITDDLRSLLDQARSPTSDVHLIGPTTIRGISVQELRVERTVQTAILPANGVIGDPRAVPTRPVRVATLVYLDSRSFLPVRIVDLVSRDLVEIVVDYLVAERLPDTPLNQRLLVMAPHPGASRSLTARVARRRG